MIKATKAIRTKEGSNKKVLVIICSVLWSTNSRFSPTIHRASSASSSKNRTKINLSLWMKKGQNSTNSREITPALGSLDPNLQTIIIHPTKEASLSSHKSTIKRRTKKTKIISQIQSLASHYPNSLLKMKRRASQNLGFSASWMSHSRSKIKAAIPFSIKMKASPLSLNRIKAAAQTSLNKAVESLLKANLKKNTRRMSPNRSSMNALKCLIPRRTTRTLKILQINNQALYFKIRVKLKRKICSLILRLRTISIPKTTAITSSRTNNKSLLMNQKSSSTRITKNSTLGKTNTSISKFKCWSIMPH